MTKSMGSGTAWAIGAAATVIVIAGGILITRSGLLSSSATDVLNRELAQQGIRGAATEEPQTVGTETGSGSAATGSTETAPLVDEVAGDAAQGETEAESYVLPAPVLDLVRVETDGNTLVAGSAAPGSSVAVVLDGTEISVTEVPDGGEFVAFLTIEAKDVPQVLSLVSRFAGQSVASEASFILAPVAVAAEQVAGEAGSPSAENGAENRAENGTETLAGTSSGVNAEASDSAAQPEAAEAVTELAATATLATEAPAVPDETEQTATAATQTSTTQSVAKQTNASPEPVELAQSADRLLSDDTSSAPAVVAEEEVRDLAEGATPAAAAPEVSSERTADRSTAVAEAQPEQIATAHNASDAAADADQQTAPQPEAQDAPDAAETTELADATVPQTPVEDTATARQSTAPAAATAATDTAQTADTPAEPESEPAPNPVVSVAVLRADNTGVTLVQPATPVAPELAGKVTLDTISYSETGDVLLAGRARPDALVRIYLDNSPVADLRALENGTWSGSLSAIAPGIYTLRVDEIDPVEGKVLSRVETPFKREAPEVLNPALSADAGSDQTPSGPAQAIRAVTVQQGDTLWAISNERYGSGFLYVRVFEANKNAIKDPDLIYPGQIFTLPE